MKISQISEARRTRNGKTLVAIHYSHFDNLKTLDASKHGKGIKGAEGKRKMAYPNEYINDRIFFYTKDREVSREGGLGIYGYTVTLKNMYNINDDADDLYPNAVEEAKRNSYSGKTYDAQLARTIHEQLIKDAGYFGYFNPRVGVGVSFYDVKVENPPTSDIKSRR